VTKKKSFITLTPGTKLMKLFLFNETKTKYAKVLFNDKHFFNPAVILKLQHVT
jgi:hypothetical protein